MTMRLLELAAMALIGLAMTTGAAYAGIAPTQTPEPASMTLLAAGVAGIALVRKLRRRK
jgi:hypothetical protein